MIPDVQGTYSLAPLAACAVAGRRLAMSPRACAFESQVQSDVLIHRRTQVQWTACPGWAALAIRKTIGAAGRAVPTELVFRCLRGGRGAGRFAARAR